MDHAVALVEAYLRVNGFFTVSETRWLKLGATADSGPPPKEGKLICGQCQSAMRLGDRNERVIADKNCVAVPVSFAVENNKVIVEAGAITEGAKTLGAAVGAVSDTSKPVAPRP